MMLVLVVLLIPNFPLVLFSIRRRRWQRRYQRGNVERRVVATSHIARYGDSEGLEHKLDVNGTMAVSLFVTAGFARRER